MRKNAEELKAKPRSAAEVRAARSASQGKWVDDGHSGGFQGERTLPTLPQGPLRGGPRSNQTGHVLHASCVSTAGRGGVRVLRCPASNSITPAPRRPLTAASWG